MYRQEFSVNDNCYVTGFGDRINTKNSLILQQLRVYVVPDVECAYLMKLNFKRTDWSNICAGRVRQTVGGVCFGDSGGPLSCESIKKYYVAGLTIFYIEMFCFQLMIILLFTTIIVLPDACIEKYKSYNSRYDVDAPVSHFKDTYSSFFKDRSLEKTYNMSDTYEMIKYFDFTLPCGTVDYNPVLAGTNREPDQDFLNNTWPWQCRFFPGLFIRPHCRGTLIDAQWMLTAAHCVYNQSYYSIQLGPEPPESEDDIPNDLRYSKLIIVHDEFDNITHSNDIALRVRLLVETEESTDWRSICVGKIGLTIRWRGCFLRAGTPLSCRIGKRYYVAGITRLNPVESKDECDSKIHLEEDNADTLTESFKLNKIKKSTFPTYVSPKKNKDDMAPDALGVVSVPPTEIVVPLYYQLYGYKPHNVHEAASGYVPVRNLRRLRTGAEDEEIRLPADQSDPCQVITEASGEAKVARFEEKVSESKAPAPFPKTLKPPESLFKPMDYPSLHIMNPAPGLQVFHPSMPYSEVDYDFHLCPLPRYPRNDRAITQKKTLDREDTIRGIMTWKKFPSPGLSSLSNTISLSNVWVPRWGQCFGTDLLPTELPPQMTQLEADDEENCTDESGSSDMFPFSNKLPNTNLPVGPNGPITRDQREKELDLYMSQRFSKLSSQFKKEYESLNELNTNPNLAVL
ncbi:hypothetical protein Btru_043434 [Bulinus truncatus]|nr:hypothetical protein Btru_043434 [Bulinus truncatus]